MKKFTLVFISFFIYCISYSQISKGNWLVGGNIAYYSNQYNTIKWHDWDFKPKGGLFLFDKCAVGVGIDYERATFKDAPAVLISESFYLTPFIRYYILKKTNKLNPFVEASYLFGQIVSKGNQNNSGPTRSSSYEGTGGVSYFLSSQLALEFGFKYRFKHSIDPSGKYDQKQIESTIGIQVYLH